MSQPTPVVAIIGRANVGKSSLFNRLVGGRQAITDEGAGTTRDPVHGLVSWGKHNFWLVDTAGITSPQNPLETEIQAQLTEAASSADAIMLVVDAVGIITSEDKKAAKLALKTGKPLVLVLNKIDAAGRHPGDQFERLGVKTIVETSATLGRGTGDLLDAITKELKAGDKPESADLRIAILGRPNVGKSSLLNRLIGSRHALVSDVAGTTRDVNQAKIKAHGRLIELSDTAGLRRRGKIEPGVEKFSTLRTIAAIAASDICLLLLDADEPSVAGDQHIAGMATDAGKGLILVVNKWDKIDKDTRTQSRMAKKIEADFQFAWWAPLVFVSAETGLNAAKLMQLAAEIDDRRQTRISTAKLNQLISTLTQKHPPAGLKHRQPKINYATQTGVAPPTLALFVSYPELIHFSYKRYLENGLRQNFDLTGTPIRLEFKDKRKAKL